MGLCRIWQLRPERTKAQTYRLKHTITELKQKIYNAFALSGRKDHTPLFPGALPRAMRLSGFQPADDVASIQWYSITPNVG